MTPRAEDRYLRPVIPNDAPQALAGPAFSPDDARDLRRARRAALWVGLVVPLALTVATTLVLLAWLPRMPDPAATHWSGGPAPDGFGAAWSFPVINAGLGLGIPVLFWAIIRFGGRGGALPGWSGYQRFLTAFGLGTVVFLEGLLLCCVAVQLDLRDAHDAPGVDAAVGIGFGVWAVVTLAAWFMQPSVRIAAPDLSGVEPLSLSETERAVWVRDVRPSPLFLGAVGVAIVICVASAVWVWTLGDALWWMNAGIAVLVILLTLCTAWFRVRIDANGLEARSALGWPVFRVSAADVESVAAAPIAPLADFGGWGLRWAPGRLGIVMRAGTGLVVHCRSGSVIGISVDDAETGAALLAAGTSVAHVATSEPEPSVPPHLHAVTDSTGSPEHD